MQKLTDYQIEEYLQRNALNLRLDKQIWELLRNPMMLTMYSRINEVERTYKGDSRFRYLSDIQTCGEYIYNYVESVLAHRYMTEIRFVERHRILVWERWLMQYVLPFIAHKMERSCCIELSIEEVHTLLLDACLQTSEQIEYLSFLFKAYDSDDGWSALQADLSDPVSLAKRAFQHLQQQATLFVYNKVNGSRSSWVFVHNLYLNFFSALHMLNVCERQIQQGEAPLEVLNQSLTSDVLDMIGDILQDYRNAPRFSGIGRPWRQNIQRNDSLHRTVDYMRGCPDTRFKIPLHNIIQVWTRARGGIEGEDFSGVDVREMTLHQSIHAAKKRLLTSFNKAYIDSNTFIPQGQTISVMCAHFSPDNSKILTAADDKTVRLWDVRTGMQLCVLHGHEDCVNSAVFNPDGTLILSASNDKTGRIWDAYTGMQLCVLHGHED
jgi:hypothetical protein